jgi:hypothetical protein
LRLITESRGQMNHGLYSTCRMAQRVGICQIPQYKLDIDSRRAEVLRISNQHSQGMISFDKEGQKS